MTTDPTAPLTERTPEQIAVFVDSHIIMALEGADRLYEPRQAAEDYVRDRLVALSDTYTDVEALHAESSRRSMERIRQALSPIL